MQTNPPEALPLFSDNSSLLPDNEYATKVEESIAPENIVELLPADNSPANNVFKKNKTGTWDFKFNGQCFPSLPSRIGFSYIQQLLQNPHKEFCAHKLSSLMSKTIEVQEPEGLSALIDEGLSVTKSSNAGQCIDNVTIKQCTNRMKELKDLIKEAHQLYDIDRKEEYQEKYNYLDTYLKQNTSSNGKPKTDKSDTRKISQAVSRSIKNAIDEINAPCPDLAEYLTAYISKGKECQYKPVLSTKWSF